ncbi:hypothetical protein EVB87_072 [Rhizobium phage RHph_N28_1]|nr:hypothetical protein EVB87_072 [Rhizobium phage RHph_N28_1]QIG74100.1 hypothetical protein EVC07_072 [Rhizobium phage RHph_N42]QIG74706.1 hypothetical protein EVC12_071 [Rhizobium phage RHph_I42]
MNRWTKEDLHEAAFVVVVGIIFAITWTPTWYALPGVILFSIVCSFLLFALVGILTGFIHAFIGEDADFNPLSWLGIGGKSYREAYAALFKAVRAYEDDADIRFFNRREVFIKAGYGVNDNRSFKDQRAAMHAWQAIKPLLVRYSPNDASLSLFTGFIKEHVG